MSHAFLSSRRVGATTASVLAGLTFATAGVGGVDSAAAAARDGRCDAGEFCYYYNSGNAGSISDLPASLADYGSTQPDCYEFKSPGAGQGTCQKNQAASVWNRTNQKINVYYNSNYKGAYQTFAPGAKGNLNATLKNQNASHAPTTTTPTGSYPAKDDYPYRGQSGIDPWNFVKGQCTSFATHAVRTRVGVPFHNQYRGIDRWGHAKYWNDAAKRTNVPVYGTPKAGDVAVREGGTYGHVAFVTRVHANGTFEVDEYNYGGTERYGHRTTSVGTANSQFSSFIRFK